MRRHPPLLAATRLARWLPVVVAFLVTSCSGGLNPVEGTVLYNGQPARGAVVAFHPKDNDTLTARTPTGVVGDSGTFTLSTSQPGDGAATGEYLVTIVWPEEAGPAKPTISAEPPPEPPDRLKGRYADRAKSGLSAVVKPGMNRLPPFELK